MRKHVVGERNNNNVNHDIAQDMAVVLLTLVKIVLLPATTFGSSFDIQADGSTILNCEEWLQNDRLLVECNEKCS